MKYSINGYTFDHAGELNKETTSRKQADALFEDMKKTILNDLKVANNSRAIIQMYSTKGRIRRESVEH